MSYEEMYDFLHEFIGVSEETLGCCFGIWGCNEQTAINILYHFTGYNSFESFFEDWNEEEDF